VDAFAFESTLTSRVPVGLVAEGLRMDVRFEGTVTEGRMTGGTVTGTDYLLLRPDGVGVMDVRDLIRLADGGAVAVRAGGYVTPAFEMPPLDMLAAPDFEWPDMSVPLHGFALLQTAEPALRVYNRTVFGLTGTVNMGRGELRIHAEPITAVAMP
jgi:hypothetical protein